jgi:hypothetical protein
MAEFPELTSFGTIFIFAQALEDNVAGLAEAALAREDCAGAAKALKTSAKKHAKRSKELANMRRERLNEVVLQRIDGMDRAEFQPPTELPGDAAAALATVAEADEVTARFYEAAADVAAGVLGGMDRKFRKLARKSRDMAAAVSAT